MDQIVASGTTMGPSSTLAGHSKCVGEGTLPEVRGHFC